MVSLIADRGKEHNNEGTRKKGNSMSETTERKQKTRYKREVTKLPFLLLVVVVAPFFVENSSLLPRSSSMSGGVHFNEGDKRRFD